MVPIECVSWLCGANTRKIHCVFSPSPNTQNTDLTSRVRTGRERAFVVLVYATTGQGSRSLYTLAPLLALGMSCALCPRPLLAFAQQHLKLLGPPNSGRSVGRRRSGVGPEFEKGDGRLRPSLQQRIPGAEGPGGMHNRPTPRRLRRSSSQLR